MRIVLCLILVFAAAPARATSKAWVARGARIAAEKLDPPFEALKVLAQRKRQPGPSDWLAQHEERGETVAEYVRRDPPAPAPAKAALEWRLLGRLDSSAQAHVDAAARFAEAFFAMPVRFGRTISTRTIPPHAWRMRLARPTQLNSTWALENAVPTGADDTAFLTAAFTSIDLFPGANWNFVYGEAVPEGRVAIFSTARLAPRTRERLLRIAVHELGHVFGLEHCVAFECVMNGINHEVEADAAPLELCPSCLQKLAWLLGFDPQERARRLSEILLSEGLAAPAALVAEELAVLTRVSKSDRIP